MANQFVTVAEAEQRVRFRSDTMGLEDRHTSEEVVKELNMSFRSLREMVSSMGVGAFLSATDPAALTTTPPVTGEKYVEVDWPTTMTTVHGVDVLQGGEWYRLRPADFSQLRELSQWRGGHRCDPWSPRVSPFWWSLISVPQASGATAAAGKLALFPVPGGGQQYRVWGLAVWSDITNAAHVFPGHSNWHDWMIMDTAVKIVIRDNNAQGTLDGLIALRAQLEQSIRRQCRMLAADGPTEPARRSDSTGFGEWSPRMIP